MSTSSNMPTRPHSPAQKWSYRVPSPPRVVIPPPALDEYGMPDFGLDQDAFVNPDNNGFGNVGFLKTVTYDNFLIAGSFTEWRYEERRKAQNVLPFMYLGPISVARDVNFLRSQGITMVLAVRNTTSAQAKLLGSKAAAELGIEGRTVDVAGNQELIAAFPRGIDIINAHLSTMYEIQQSTEAQGMSASSRASSAPGKVLVYCESGNERSASLVAAYIMAMYSIPVAKAIQIVQNQRFCVAFDDASKVLLQTYGAILQAKRDVLQAGIGPPNHSMSVGTDQSRIQQARSVENKPASKRTLDETYEDDIDMDGDPGYTDDDRFEGRGGNAPFQDRYPNSS